jgi:adenylosuccinate synthase
MKHGPHVTAIIDGQYGSCGKGMICGYLANEYDVAVRVGAPNAGHTLKVGKDVWKMRQIPVAGLINKEMVLAIGAAGLINLEVLEKEIAMVPNCAERLYIDRNAGIMEHKHVEQEEAEKMFQGIGSTCEGVGAALRDKIKRDKTFRTAKDLNWKGKAHICNVSLMLNSLAADQRVMLEGTQGYALSLNHGPYPYCTSRDVLASSLLSDVGLSPFICDNIIMVIRTYPIRVAGNSGPMCGKELTWEEVTKRSKYPHPLVEQTTVTKRIRRVCEFDMDLVVEATLVNRPTQIALTFADYLDYANYGVTQWEKLTKKSKKFIEDIEDETNTPVTLIQTGFEHEAIIDRRKELYDEGIHQ